MGYGPQVKIPYLFDQAALSISCHSRIVAAPLDMLNEIVVALHAHVNLVTRMAISKHAESYTR